MRSSNRARPTLTARSVIRPWLYDDQRSPMTSVGISANPPSGFWAVCPQNDGNCMTYLRRRDRKLGPPKRQGGQQKTDEARSGDKRSPYPRTKVVDRETKCREDGGC